MEIIIEKEKVLSMVGPRIFFKRIIKKFKFFKTLINKNFNISSYKKKKKNRIKYMQFLLLAFIF